VLERQWEDVYDVLWNFDKHEAEWMDVINTHWCVSPCLRVISMLCSSASTLDLQVLSVKAVMIRKVTSLLWPKVVSSASGGKLCGLA
jgi:hypothetical protein